MAELVQGQRPHILRAPVEFVGKRDDPAFYLDEQVIARLEPVHAGGRGCLAATAETVFAYAVVGSGSTSADPSSVFAPATIPSMMSEYLTPSATSA